MKPRDPTSIGLFCYPDTTLSVQNVIGFSVAEDLIPRKVPNKQRDNPISSFFGWNWSGSNNRRSYKCTVASSGLI